ncbi:sensor histidine kinase [Salmonirosea aquatica]|uniref:histidine kinase n=1 Tax=Salmonirosea aquatica TaxID=2654236 RepID=A0A7C9FAJ3_9BACT|nr:hypothetical protein [Cytophagaceae bacterium SJW1-29]
MLSRSVFLLLFGLALPGVAQSVFPLIAEKRQYAEEVEKEARAKGDTLLLAEAYYLYGKMYAFAGDHAASKTSFLKSLRLLEPRGDSYELGRLYIRLSENSQQIAHSQDEILYAYRAKTIFERIHSLKGQVLANATLARVYERLHPNRFKNGLPDSALIYLRKAESFTRQLRDSLGLAVTYMQIGELFLFRNDPRAVPYLEESLRWLNLKPNLRDQLNTTLLLGRAHLNAGRNEKALAKIKEAAKLYKDNHLNDHVLAATLDRAMIAYYEKTNQWRLAYERFGDLYEKETVQFASERDGVLARLQIEYDTEKKENKLKEQAMELSLTTQSLRFQRIIAISSLLLFLITGVSSILFFRLFRKNQRISQQNQYLVQEQKHRAQNNLQVLSSLFNMQARLVTDPGSKRTMEENRLRVQSMALIQRKLDEDTQSDAIDLPLFIPELTTGILNAFGFSQIEVRFTIDPIVLGTDQAVPIGLILNELITNACKYAFPDNPDPVLTIVCRRISEKIGLKIMDNGPGLPDYYPIDTPIRKSKKDSFGMQLIRILVEQVRGSYSFDSSKGTLFNMHFISQSVS